MALKSVNLLEFIFYHNFQIFNHKKTLAYTGMMVWYYFETQMDNQRIELEKM